MLDISRDRVPTRATLSSLVELMELARINHFELYTEHTFAYAAHETVWRDASPMTANDIRWLDQLCAAKGIELVANQACFGHMERWLKHDAYRCYAEAPDGWTTSWGAKWQAAVLHPDDASFDLVRMLFEELLPNFSSNVVNINCDETFELGKGRSEQRVRERGRGQVYLDFVARIVEDLHRQEKQVLFWGDVIRQHPELVKKLPKSSTTADTTALVWHYDAPLENPSLPAGLESILAEVGITEDVLRGFAGQVPAFSNHGVPFWVCPGTSTWNSLLGRLTNAKSNLIDAANVGAAHGAAGYLITDWGDNGHMQPVSASYAPLLYGAGVSWCLDTNREVDLAATLDRHVFHDGSGRLGAAFVRAADVYRQSGADAFNGSPLFYALLDKQGFFGGNSKPTEEGIARVLDELDNTAREIASSDPLCPDADVLKRELLQAIELTHLGARRLAATHSIATPALGSWSTDLREAIEEQEACWLARSRPGGLDDSLAKLTASLE